MSKDSAEYYKPREWPTDGPVLGEPWLKWPEEPERDYARFQAFRDLPPPRRSPQNAYLVYTGHPYAGEDRPKLGGMGNGMGVWYGLKRKWRWDERCTAFDRWKEKSQLEAERDGTLQAWKEMGERHAREAMALQQKALERLRTLNPEELSAAEVRQFLVQAATLERLARGASLQDMARVQREKEQEAAQDGYAVVTFIDDWRGDAKRKAGGRNPDSYYGNGQGVLPSLIPSAPSPVPQPDTPPPKGRRRVRKSEGLPLVTPAGGRAAPSGRTAPFVPETDLPVPGPPSGPDHRPQET